MLFTLTLEGCSLSILALIRLLAAVCISFIACPASDCRKALSISGSSHGKLAVNHEKQAVYTPILCYFNTPSRGWAFYGIAAGILYF